MRRAYEGSINVRFAVEAENGDDVDAIAATFFWNLVAWVGGSLGSAPFAPWMTAWADESALHALPLKEEQLWNWNSISDPAAPFDED
jgi:hypothetical protein